MNIELDNLTMEEALTIMDEMISKNRNAYVVTPNVDHLVQIENGSKLREVYQDADLILTDGKPLIWISKLYGTPIKEKISGSDLFPRLCEMAAVKGYSMFFLGAAEGVALTAANNLTRQFPGLNVVGTYSPPYGFEKDSDEIKKIIRIVREKAPQILVVGLGCPKQELFIYEYREAMGVPLSLGLGASLDFAAGNVKRSPKWMADHGLEWFYRFTQEPKRLFKRYFIDDIKIIKLIIKYAIK